MTKIFTWYDKFSVNNEEIDNQHKVLFDIFNRLYESCVENQFYLGVELLVSELEYYAKYHFTSEEKYMRDTGYKNIERHIEEHKLFTDKISMLKSAGHINDYEHSKELVIYLWEWILKHIMVEDKKIAG
jgi:hemerythrin